jgi:hypothetical protein
MVTPGPTFSGLKPGLQPGEGHGRFRLEFMSKPTLETRIILVAVTVTRAPGPFRRVRVTGKLYWMRPECHDSPRPSFKYSGIPDPGRRTPAWAARAGLWGRHRDSHGDSVTCPGQ